ncbi:methylcytosine dioxygenase tet3-like isoform X1 [Myxocyprinus asiaticus]|uniref:methylcytosine dioxygenase tet3-like isoform X1 n=2 Tax=Myxocyprinus asiaticus TaxID=70543 RepID=UPI0022219735|nr:methylcytosine dioxygenase tet3-like isoform X1 [Myxocyprinus asiaticus]XP_051527016.1 methylcytosine dioxygenase tet3-like isoform X1 [Myxocyprinus asiaticus]
MHKLRGGPGPPIQDIYEFSPDEEDPKVFLGARVAKVVSPVANYIRSEHEQAGLFSLPQMEGQELMEPVVPQKKKRKRCAVCGPCMRKENCGTCSNCLNRKVGHQICKLRKCDELKRRKSLWEVEYFEDIKARSIIPNLAKETVSVVGSVDGPRGRGQMEIGSHDRLEEGVLDQELSNGLSKHATNEENICDEGGGDVAREQHQHSYHTEPGGISQTPGWGSEHAGKLTNFESQQGAWSDQNPSKQVNDVDMEDARTLVAFSATVGSLATYSNHQPSPTQLYERFNQEMSNGGEKARQKGVDGELFPTEDLDILQAALSKARDGHKPPNCDCDGPDCPDYLEWLKKQIKMVTNCQFKGSCKVSNAPPQPHLQHRYAQSQPQQCGSNPLCQQDTNPQPPVNQPSAPRPFGPPAPIPCSPSVLSIAKERNVSLQTAIAIEALTQLSATVPQTIVPSGEFSPANNHLHLPTSYPQSKPQLVSSSPVLLSSSSATPHSIPPGNYPKQDPSSWEQQRPQSQGDTPAPNIMPSSSHYATQYSSSKSPFTGLHPSTPNPRPQQQDSTGSCEKSSPRNSWMMNSESQPHFVNPSHGSSDPVSELKQLLGDSGGKYTNSAFKFPLPQPSLQDGRKGSLTGVPHIKQEVDTKEYPGSGCLVMGQEGMVNGQQQFHGQQFSPSIRHSTQAALQQHLHHKRNLFSNSPGFSLLAPMACQNLRKWWPQTLPETPVTIKQEHKEPKKKKSAQSFPLLKYPVGGIYSPLGLPLPKPKQIVIKKHKQKASQPTFLPQSQITILKTPLINPGYAPSLCQLAPSLPGMEAGLPPSQVAESHPAPAQSQESTSNSSSAPISENTQSSTPVSVIAPSNQKVIACSGPAGSNESVPMTSIRPQTSTTQSSPSLTGLSTLDPKFEDLIRQFEEEFGDNMSSASAAETPEHGPFQPVATESQPNSNSGQARCESPSPKQPKNCPPVPTTQSEPMDEGQKGMTERVKEETPLASEQLYSVKQESEECEVDVKSGQLLSVAQGAVLERHHPFITPFTPPTKRMKIESSGGVTVLSTTACFSADGEDKDLDTPTKDIFPASPSLKGFLESPLRYLDTPTKSLLETPVKDAQVEFPTCDCVDQILEKDEGPYYNHLGSGPTVAAVRELMEKRYGEKGEAIRIEKLVYTGREGKSSQGCPIAKWVIRRSSEAEKLLCLVKQRPGHHCANTVIIVVILAWEGVPRALGDKLYRELTETITKYGNATSRRCGLNDGRTCACQGKDPDKCGASFSFGCSWSMYFNGCKYARSKTPRKFRLQGEHPKEEDYLRDNFQNLATHVAPLYKQLAPQAYSNQCVSENIASDCRLGLKEGRPFSGVTACMDFCAHAHKDQHNLHNGCTVVCTFTKEDNRSVGTIPDDEQLHVLPLYKISLTDENGSEENQRLKMQTGAIQVLANFRREVRKLPEPAKSCRQRRMEAKKAASEKKNKRLQLAETPEKTIKMETHHTDSPHPQQGNKAILKQEVKPTIKKEPVDRFQPFNGAIHGYPALGNGKATPDPHSMNSSFSYPCNYARGRIPTNSQPPALSPINGFHPNLQAMRYGYYNYPPNALFPPELLSYGNGAWAKAGEPPATSFDQKPDVQSLQAKMAQPYSNQYGQTQQQMSDSSIQGYPHPSDFSQSPVPHSHTPSVSLEQTHHSTPIIKQEPMDVPLYDGRSDGQGQSCPSTPSTTSKPEGWPGHKPNGSLVSKGWEGNHRSSSANSPFTSDKQRLHQQHRHQHEHPQYAQQQQWNSYPRPNTPVSSPAPSPSPSIKAGLSPALSPHPSTPRQWDSPAPSPQPKAWGPYGPIGYGAGGLRQDNPTGAFPDKMLSQAGENCGSAPLGLQEKAWKSGGGSAAGSTPSPAPEGRLFPDALQRSNGQACWDSEAEAQSEHDPEEEEVWSDSEHNFLDPNIGGVAVAPAHGSVLIECARRELHATTPLKKPDRTHPSRISLVFYQHKNLNQPCHGLALWEAKMKLLAERARQRQQEAALLGLSQDEIKAYGKKRKWAAGSVSPSPGQTKDKRDGVVTRMAPTQHTTTIVNVSPYPSTHLTGPYSRFV